MDDFEERRRVGKHGTDLQSVEDVQQAATRLIWKKYGGWSSADQEDLLQAVMIKYFQKFGRDRLPDDVDGNPAVPIGWLIACVKTTGIDVHRAQKVRPADPVDFQGPDAIGLDQLLNAVNPRPSLSSDVAQQLDLQRALGPALKSLQDSYPMDVKLLVWRFVQDRDLEAISTIRGTSVDATKKAIQRAANRLRTLLAAAPAHDLD